MYYATHTPGPTRPQLKPMVFRFETEDLRDSWLTENPQQRAAIDTPADTSGFHVAPMRINGHLVTAEAREWTAEDAGPVSIDDYLNQLEPLGNTPGRLRMLNPVNFTIGTREGEWVAIYGEGFVKGGRETKEINANVGMAAPELLEIVRLLVWTDVPRELLVDKARDILGMHLLFTKAEAKEQQAKLARETQKH